MSNVSYRPYFSQWKQNIYFLFFFFLREKIRCPGKQSKPASSTTIWLGDSSGVIPVLAVQLSQSPPISQMTHLEKYIPELVIHPLHLPNLPIWDHRCWLNPRRKWMRKGSKRKSISISSSEYHQASAEVGTSQFLMKGLWCSESPVQGRGCF